MDRQEKISELIKTAKSLVRTPYKYGAYLDGNAAPTEGFDCSSFIQFVFRKSGIEIPRSSILQAAHPGEEIANIENAEIGDLIFFEGDHGHYRHDLFPGRKIYIGHLGIYLGNGKIIHASNNKLANGVAIQTLSDLEKNFGNAYKPVLIKRFI